MIVEFVFDYPSPYAYLASFEIEKLGVEVRHIPISVYDVMSKVNNQPTPNCPPKAQYALMDAARWAERRNVAFAPNMTFIQALMEGNVDTALLPRCALAAQELGVFDIVNNAIFSAIWASNGDLLSGDARVDLLNKLGLNGRDLWQLASEDRTGKALDRNNQEAIERGVFGVPTAFVNDEMFFGNDRFSFIQHKVAATAGQVLNRLGLSN